jgi:adenylosuccinate lyase
VSYSPLFSISPIDGRYFNQTKELRNLFSEYALIRFRVLIEIRWLQTLANHPQIHELKPFSEQQNLYLNNLIDTFDLKSAQKIKDIEKVINHDTKAVEYFIKEQLKNNPTLSNACEWVHFACTSEDINNIAYGLILTQGREQFLLPAISQLIQQFKNYAHQYANQAMLARTHGQPAVPTTVGKEFSIIAHRLIQQQKNFAQIKLSGKFNGAVGNYNAHVFAYPEIDWQIVSKQFVNEFGLHWQAYTTQIESHDTIVQYCDALRHINNILIGVADDLWHYIAIEYFKQKTIAQEIGSSTMPHKVNPIFLENAQANLSLANALLRHFSDYLTHSRWQRDLRDSTLKRNLGVSVAHSLLAYHHLTEGFSRIEINTQRIENDLTQHWEVLAEALQIILKRYCTEMSFETIKELTHGQCLDQKKIHNIIQNLSLPEKIKQVLYALKPKTYLGYAQHLAEQI